MTINDGGISDKDMENFSFYVLVNILHFLPFSNCISFIFCLFHPIDKKKWQCNERRILDRYMDIFKKILTNVLHFLSNDKRSISDYDIDILLFLFW